MDGICTLANDRVYDQVVALLNSIEAIAGKEMPVCIYPYDDNIAKLSLEVSKRSSVQIYNSRESIDRWDDFAQAAWDTHPTANQIWQQAGSKGYHRFGTHRRYCAFDAPFDRFLYMDADTLLMSPVDNIFNLLNSNDCVVYDFQHKDTTHVYTVTSPKLATVFSPQRIATEIFCSGFYASKKDLFTEERRKEIINYLKSGEAEILYPMAPDQTLINYMMMRSGCSIYNLALHLPKSEVTGCCVTSSHFKNQDRILYDKGKRLTYIHYIGLSSRLFTRVCEGENINFPYRDLFLYYRYLHKPEKRPQFTTKAKAYNQPRSLAKRIMSKLGLK
ncbi:MAG: sugar transferase [Xenococcaceae cyanobacterium MO_188.B32]|nr:sugar transferase [Xenococcaceae cyanobacterium MO_188.B32]